MKSILLIVALLGAALASAQLEGWRFYPTSGYTSQAAAYYNGVIAYADSRNLYAVNSVTGLQMWGRWLSSSTFRNVWQRNGVFLVLSDKYFGAVTPQGVTQWNITSNGTSGWDYSMGLLFPNNNWIYAFVDGNIVKINAATGDLTTLQNYNTYAFASTLIGSNILLMSPSYATLYNTSTAGMTNTIFDKSYSYTFSSGIGMTIPTYMDMYFGTSSCTTLAMNASTGAVIWSQTNSNCGTVYGLMLTANATGSQIVMMNTDYIYVYDAVSGSLMSKFAPVSTTWGWRNWYYDQTKNWLWAADYNGNIMLINCATWTQVWAVAGPSNYNPSSWLYVNGTMYFTLSYTLYVLNATGSYRQLFTFSNTIYQAFVNPDLYGGTIVVRNTNGLVTVMPVSGPTQSWKLDSYIRTASTWGGAAYFTTSSMVTALGANGTQIWSTAVADTPSSSIPPVFSAGRVFVALSTYKFAVFNAYTGALITTIDPTSPTTGKSTCTSTDMTGSLTMTPVVDGSDVFFVAGTTAVWRIASDNTLYCAKADNSVTQPVSTSFGFVYATDSLAATYGFFKPTMTRAYKATAATDDMNRRLTPLYVDGDLYPGDNYGNLFCLGSNIGNKLWKVSLDGSSNDVDQTFTYQDYVYATQDNGKVYNFQPGYLLLTANHYKMNWVQPVPATTLSAPAISPDGVMIFTAYNGIFAVRHNGTSLWNWTSGITCDATMPASVYMGVVYAQCNSRVYLIDLYKGVVWLRTNTFSSSYYQNTAFINNTIFFFDSTTLSLISPGAAQLYTANQLPAPLPPRGLTPTELLERSKLWIAGLIAAIVVIVIIVLIVKKCSGGKKDTDYVAMQNPVNTGGV